MPVQHIALFKFKAGTPQSTAGRALDDLRRLAKIIPGITSFTAGLNNSPEGLSDGLTHGFVMAFKDAPARNAYLSHPEHEKFKAFALLHIERSSCSTTSPECRLPPRESLLSIARTRCAVSPTRPELPALV